MKSDRILGLEIGGTSVKLVALERGKSASLRLVQYGSVDFPTDLPEAERDAAVTGAIKELLHKHGLKGGRAAISVTGQFVFTRFVKLPAATPDKIERMVGFEAQQNVPFPMNEVVWDYQLIGGASEKGEYEVVLVAVKSDLIEGLVRAVDAAGVRVELVDVSSLALYNAIRYNYEVEDGCLLVLDVGARNTNLIFIEKDKVFTRSVPMGGNTITQEIVREFEELKLSFAQAEELKRSKGFVGLGGAYEEPEDPLVARLSKVIRNVMTRIHADVTRSIIFYRTQQGGKPPTRLLLTGVAALLPYTDYFFEEKLQAKVEFFNPFRNIELGSVNKESLSQQAAGFGEAVGLALRLATQECPIEVNLLPKFVIEQREFNRKKIYFAGCAVGLALAGFGLSCYFDRMADEETKQLTKIETRLKHLTGVQTQMKKLEADRDRFLKIKDQIKDKAVARSRWPLILDELTKRIPTDTWIIKLEPVIGSNAPATPDGQPPPPPPPGAAQKSVAGMITELTIDGAIVNPPKSADETKTDVNRPAKVGEFVSKLQECPEFDATGIRIEKSARVAKEGDFCYTFTIVAKLKEPISQ